MMRSVQRILAIFESFSQERSTLTLQEISKRIELPKSTTFRIVQSLEESGYLIRLQDQHYCLSFRFTRLSGLVQSTLGIREIARPFLVELAKQTQESVSIHTLIEKDRVCLDAMSTSSTLRSVIQPGEHVPILLGTGSASKVLLAHMPDKAKAQFISAIAKTNKQSKTDLLRELSQIRTKGYAISHGERLLGVTAISTPIRDAQDEVPYCLSIGGPSVRVKTHEKEFTKLAVLYAGKISLQLGASARAH